MTTPHLTPEQLDALEALAATYEQAAPGCQEIRAYGELADAFVDNAEALIAAARKLATVTAERDGALKLAYAEVAALRSALEKAQAHLTDAWPAETRCQRALNTINEALK